MSLSLDLPDDLLELEDSSQSFQDNKPQGDKDNQEVKDAPTSKSAEKAEINLDLPSESLCTATSVATATETETMSMTVPEKEVTKESEHNSSQSPSVSTEVKSDGKKEVEEKAEINLDLPLESLCTATSVSEEKTVRKIPDQPNDCKKCKQQNTPIPDKRMSFHMLDEEENDTNSLTSGITIPIEFILPNKPTEGQVNVNTQQQLPIVTAESGNSIEESVTQERIFSIGESTPEKRKNPKDIRQDDKENSDTHKTDSTESRNNTHIDEDKEESRETDDEEINYNISDYKIVTVIPGKANSGNRKKGGRTKKRQRHRRNNSDDDDADEESNKELEKEINKSPHLSQLPEARRMKGENEKEKPDPISEETQKKQTRNRKRLRKTASLLGKDSENGVEIGAGCADRSTQQRENRYSLRSILETLDFDTYKNSLFEYDDTGEKDETGPDTDNEKAAAQQSTTHSSLTVKRHTKPFGESSKEAADAQTQKRAETKKKGEGGTKANSKDTNADIEEEEEKEKEEEEPAPKRVKRGGGLPIFRGLHFFLTRLPQEIGCAVRKVIPRDNIFSTAAAAFEYVTCCNKRKRFKAPETFLIATQPIRTAKYIMALALGVPCVSHEWILQSVEANRLCDYRDFLLPRGFSVLEKTLVTAKHILNEARPLDGVRVELLFQNKEWNYILKAAGAKTVRRLFTQDETRIDYVFSPPLPPGQKIDNPDIIQHVNGLAIPIVNVDWLIHCIVVDRYVEPTDYPDVFID